jgi:hypothetical protein
MKSKNGGSDAFYWSIYETFVDDTWMLWLLGCWNLCLSENKRELVVDLVRKAKQIELLIESLPPPEPEESQVWFPVFYRLYLLILLLHEGYAARSTGARNAKGQCGVCHCRGTSQYVFILL